MNRIDDNTIERYLDGSMSAAEHSRFQAMMADDPTLQRRVASEESMMRALRADRDVASRNHAAVRSRVLGSISQIAPASGAVALPPSRTRGRWPLFGAVLVIATWVAIDLVNTPSVMPPRDSAAPTNSISNGAVPRTTEPIDAGSDATQVDAGSSSRSDAGSDAQAKTQSPSEMPAARQTTTARESGTRSGMIERKPAATSTSAVADPRNTTEIQTPVKKSLQGRVDSTTKTSVRIED